MREYVKSHGVKVTPEQLALLVPAFDLAWQLLCKRDGFLRNGGSRAAKDGLAEIVVEIVMAGAATTVEAAAEAAVTRALARGAGSDALNLR